MSVKSIVEIDVQDASFKRFQELFDKYQTQLSRTPAAWAQVSDEQKGIASNFEKMAAALMAQHEVTRELDISEKERLANLGHTERLWTSISKSSTHFAKNVIDASTTLLKWGGLIFGGLTAGSLFGIDKMASGVSDDWRAARGKGLSIGEMKSFGLNFGRVVDPESFLGQVNSMMTDPRQSWHSMGVNLNDTTAHVALNLLEKMRARALMTPVNQLGLLDQQTGLSMGETWRRLHDMTNSEWMAQRAHFLKDIGSLNINSPRGWTDLNTQFSRMWDQMRTATENALGTPKMTAALGQFSDSASQAWQRFLTSPGVTQGLDKMTDWLNNFSGSVDTDTFMKKVDALVSDTGILSDAIHTLAWAYQHPGEALGKAAAKAVKADFTSGQASRWAGIKTFANWIGLGQTSSHDDRLAKLQHLAELDKKYGLAPHTLEFIWGKESSFGKNAFDQPGKNGAMGDFQIKPSMSGGANMHDFDAASERAAQIVRDDLKKFGSIEAGIAGFHLGDPTIEQILVEAKRHKIDWRKAIPYLSGWQGSPNAGGMTGQIGNTTVTLQANVTPGNSIVLTTNQLAGGR